MTGAAGKHGEANDSARKAVGQAVPECEPDEGEASTPNAIGASARDTGKPGPRPGKDEPAAGQREFKADVSTPNAIAECARGSSLPGKAL